MDDVRAQAGEQRRVPRGGRDDRPRAGPARRHPPDDGVVDAEHVDPHPRVHLGDEVGQADLRPTDAARIGAGDDVHQAGTGAGPRRRRPGRLSPVAPGAVAVGLPVRPRRRQQLLGVRAAGVRLVEPGEHPRELADPLVLVQRADPAAGRPVARPGLVDQQVPVGVRRDLRQVRHDHHLVPDRQPGQPAADLHRGPASHPGVDLVEDHRRYRVRAGQRDLERQHDPRQLPAGRAFVQRLRRRARVGDEPQLDLVDAVRARDDERIADPQRVGERRARPRAA